MSAKEATKDGRTSGDGGLMVAAKNLHGDGSDAGQGIVCASGEVDNGALVSGKEANAEQEVIDIDLEDPDVKKAASLIQSGFKGRMMRKKMAAQSTNLPIQVEKQTKLEPAKVVAMETRDHEAWSSLLLLVSMSLLSRCEISCRCMTKSKSFSSLANL